MPGSQAHVLHNHSGKIPFHLRKVSAVSVTDHAPTLGELVVQQPRAAALFERLGLDYCCGGARTLEQACDQQGLDAKTVSVLLRALADEPRGADLEAHDVGRATIPELCEHIVTRHHEPVRRDLARIGDLMGTVVRVHGRTHRELLDLQRLFTAIRSDLETHMRTEEQTLFPACRALDDDPESAVFDADLLVLLEDDHATTGAALCALREVAGGYGTDAPLCSTHRTMLNSLRAFELDMHQHVHEENNVLFPRVRARIAA
jgi:regulator of cell morphogenesis and NO signaling